MKRSVFIRLCMMMAFYGCTKEAYQPVVRKPPGCDSTKFTFEKDIRPVIIANCSGPACHSGGNSNYNLVTYEALADRVRSGRLEERVLLPVNDPLYMPAGGTLSECDLFTLITWIRQGYKKN